MNYDNQLEISIDNNNIVGSSRTLQIVSPTNMRTMSTESLPRVTTINRDNIGFTRVTSIRLPFLRLAVDITLSALEIKKIFITEMTK
jgi:hypothetical protein